jgi:hypothetical protein
MSSPDDDNVAIGAAVAEFDAGCQADIERIQEDQRRLGAPVTFAPSDLVACVEREIAMRNRVYPRWVAAGRVPQARADQEIALMRAVLAVLKERAPAPAPPAQRDLFGVGSGSR